MDFTRLYINNFSKGLVGMNSTNPGYALNKIGSIQDAINKLGSQQQGFTKQGNFIGPISQKYLI